MQPRLDNAALTLADATLDALPDCPGVYRFFGAQDQLLYVGKSVAISTRVRSHYAGARRPGRQQRMMQAVARIDCEPCCGEVGALLRENAAIKREIPLYNRRQRRQRHLWTLLLETGANDFLQVALRQLPGHDGFATDCYGLYRSKTHAEDTLRRLAREQGLCLRTLGLEPGRGPCFSFQLRRCRGACAGVESPAEHDARLCEALQDQRILAWPFDAPVLLQEAATERRACQPRQDWHAIDQWRYIGSFHRARRAAAAIKGAATTHSSDAAFDRDAYLILLRALRSGMRVHSAASLEPLENPLARDPFAA